MNDRLRSRKFTLSVTAFFMASIFLYIGKIAGSEWVTITIFILGLYGTANVMEKKNDASNS